MPKLTPLADVWVDGEKVQGLLTLEVVRNRSSWQVKVQGDSPPPPADGPVDLRIEQDGRRFSGTALLASTEFGAGGGFRALYLGSGPLEES